MITENHCLDRRLGVGLAKLGRLLQPRKLVRFLFINSSFHEKSGTRTQSRRITDAFSEFLVPTPCRATANAAEIPEFPPFAHMKKPGARPGLSTRCRIPPKNSGRARLPASSHRASGLAERLPTRLGPLDRLGHEDQRAGAAPRRLTWRPARSPCHLFTLSGDLGQILGDFSRGSASS